MRTNKKLRLKLSKWMRKEGFLKYINLIRPRKRCLKVKLKQSLIRSRGWMPSTNLALSCNQKSVRHPKLNLQIWHVTSQNKERAEVRQRMELRQQRSSSRSILSSLHLSISASSTSVFGSCLIITKMFISLKKVTCVCLAMRTQCRTTTSTTISST